MFLCIRINTLIEENNLQLFTSALKKLVNYNIRKKINQFNFMIFFVHYHSWNNTFFKYFWEKSLIVAL